MSWATLHNALRGRFEVEITNARQVWTRFDNTSDLVKGNGAGGQITLSQPDPAQPWVRFTVTQGETFQAETGGGDANNTYRTAGTAVAQVFVPANTGTATAMQLADWIAEAFRAVTVSGIVCTTPNVKTIGDVDSWWQANVICPYQQDVVY